jgi:hypothetical protein
LVLLFTISTPAFCDDPVPIPGVTVYPSPFVPGGLMSTYLVYHLDGAGGGGGGGSSNTPSLGATTDIGRSFMPPNKLQVSCGDVGAARQSAANSAFSAYRLAGGTTSPGGRYTIHFSDGSESYTQTNSTASSVPLSATPGASCQ